MLIALFAYVNAVNKYNNHALEIFEIQNNPKMYDIFPNKNKHAGS